MDPSNSIVNLGELSKPANTLIEKISDAIGGIFKPYQIRRVAQAEAEAERIKAVSQIEISEIQQRAIQRFFFEEAKKQQNIESITQLALPEVSEQAQPQNINDDWITNFFDKCRLISDEEMQKLWSKVLSGETNSPGKYSKRTIDLLSSLDKWDADLFAKLNSHSIYIGEIIPLVYDENDEIYKSNGINFGSLTHLDSIGLIKYEHLTGFNRTGISHNGFVHYFGTPIWIEFPKPSDNVMNAGKIMLTKAGLQLAPLCNSIPIKDFPDYLKDKWKGFGYKVEKTENQ